MKIYRVEARPIGSQAKWIDMFNSYTRIGDAKARITREGQSHREYQIVSYKRERVIKL